MLNNRYEILQLLSGEGGMGDVFLGKDHQSGQRVAIKFMRLPQSGDLSHSNRAWSHFDREIDISLNVEHPNILQAIDHGETDYNGQFVPFLVSPYIEGGSLQNLINREKPWRTWTLPQLADIILQAAQGLYALHTEYRPPIIHLDVKPANVLLERLHDQESHHIVHIWLTDFGIARWQHGPSHRTAHIAGTQGYMAPEYFPDSEVDAAADQYSLAALAHYLFTGSPPNLLSLRLPLSQLNPERPYSRTLEAVILKAVSIEPKERYPSVLDFAEALYAAALQQSKPGFYEAPTDPDPQPTPPPVPETQVLPPEPEFKPIPIYDHSISLQPIDTPLPPEPPPAPSVEPPSQATLPRFPLHILATKKLAALPNMLAWAPDGTALLCSYYGRAPELFWNSGAKEEITVLSSARSACWSPDSRRLAVSTKGNNGASEVYLWNLDTSSADLLFSASAPPIDGLDWSNSGQLAIWVADQILLYNSERTASHTLYLEPDASCGDLGTLRWSPDAHWLAAGTITGTLIWWRASALQPYMPARQPDSRISSLAWSADSQLLAVGFQNRCLQVWHVPERRLVLNMPDLPAQPRMVSFSAWDNTLVLAQRRKILFSQQGMKLEAEYPGQLLAVWAPNGSMLATLDARNETQLLILRRS